MPKLPKNIQKKAAEAEVRDYSALPEGIYIAKVHSVETGKSAAGNDKWVVRFTVLADQDGEKVPGNRQLFAHLALTEAAAWKVRELFEALGFTLDSDSDELIGELLRLQVSASPIADGQRKGELGNNIDAFLEYDPSIHPAVDDAA